jgi:hypothetical protein
MIPLWIAVAPMGVGAELPQSNQSPRADHPIDRLLPLADPLNDDWDGEKLWARSKDQLSALSKWLKSADSSMTQRLAFATDDAAATALRPSPLETKSLSGGITVARFQRGVPLERSFRLRESLHNLIAPLREASSSPRVEFKVVGIEVDSQREWTTTVRYEGFNLCGRTALEQTAYWSVRWTAVQESDPPLIRGVDLLSFEEVRREQPNEGGPTLYHDATRAVLQEGWDDSLRLGGEYWYGKIDAVGEINFFGHNGIAIGDANGDGQEDVYVALGTGLPNKLLIRQPDGTVRDTAEASGVAWLDDTKGVLFADTDNDGDQDLLCAIGPTIVLCKNDGSGRFDRFISMRAPAAASFYSLAAADYDLDGDLDIYGCRYVHVQYGVSVPQPFFDANNGPTNHLLRNDGQDRFQDVTEEVGLNVNNNRFSLAAGWADYDNDGDPDLCVANDFGRNNLYRNEGGRFVDVAAAAGAEDQAAGMGVSWADFDLDGHLDLYVSNMFSSAGNRIAYQSRFMAGDSAQARFETQRLSWGNSLLRNQGDGTFRDVSESANVRMGRWAWGAKFVDLDNDGYEDLFVPNGFLTNDRKDDL